jgi:hypothetical protein
MPPELTEVNPGWRTSALEANETELQATCAGDFWVLVSNCA